MLERPLVAVVIMTGAKVHIQGGGQGGWMEMHLSKTQKSGTCCSCSLTLLLTLL